MGRPHVIHCTCRHWHHLPICLIDLFSLHWSHLFNQDVVCTSFALARLVTRRQNERTNKKKYKNNHHPCKNLMSLEKYFTNWWKYILWMMLLSKFFVQTTQQIRLWLVFNQMRFTPYRIFGILTPFILTFFGNKSSVGSDVTVCWDKTKLFWGIWTILC